MYLKHLMVPDLRISRYTELVLTLAMRPSVYSKPIIVPGMRPGVYSELVIAYILSGNIVTSYRMGLKYILCLVLLVEK